MMITSLFIRDNPRYRPYTSRCSDDTIKRNLPHLDDADLASFVHEDVVMENVFVSVD